MEKEIEQKIAYHFHYKKDTPTLIVCNDTDLEKFLLRLKEFYNVDSNPELFTKYRGIRIIGSKDLNPKEVIVL